MALAVAAFAYSEGQKAASLRRARIMTIDGIKIEVNRERLPPPVVRALYRERYESRECQMVREVLLRPCRCLWSALSRTRFGCAPPSFIPRRTAVRNRPSPEGLMSFGNAVGTAFIAAKHCPLARSIF